jgi:hypothetical protein
MVIRKRNGNVFDIFLAKEGWGHWVCVKRTQQGVSVIGGARISRNTIKQIEETLK